MESNDATGPPDTGSAPEPVIPSPERASEPVSAVRPLVVDLDGTLVDTDLMLESFWGLVSCHPHQTWRVPFWALRGKAHLKSELGRRADLNVSALPYRSDVVELIRKRKENGGRVVLATASDRLLAERVASHVGLFDLVLASDGDINCRGAAKLAAIRRALGGEPFDYVGDSAADLPVIREADRVWLVNPSGRLNRAVTRMGKLETILTPPVSQVGAALRLLRPAQAAKNLLLFVPLIAARQYHQMELVQAAALGFLCFTLAAWALYILNDLCDLESDRGHPRKRLRPLAAGHVSIGIAMGMAAVLACGSAGLALTTLPRNFTLVLGGYGVLAGLYTISLKRKVFVDVLALAALYSCRIFAGGEATGIVISEWLTAFAMFFFLSLALTKRYCELDRLRRSGGMNPRRGYRGDDLDLLRTIGPVSGYLAVLVLALYIGSDATAVYPHRRVLWSLCVVLLYWITRLWFLAQRGELDDDPVLFALKDKRSLLAGLLAVLILAAASAG
jgi:4-hydroxybenzoate polyprenyltransferase/phosphoserine phosphatase